MVVITSVTTQERAQYKSMGPAQVPDISDDATCSPKTGTPPSATQRKRRFEALTPSPPRGTEVIQAVNDVTCPGHVKRKRSVLRTDYATRASNANGSVGLQGTPDDGVIELSLYGADLCRKQYESRALPRLINLANKTWTQMYRKQRGVTWNKSYTLHMFKDGYHRNETIEFRENYKQLERENITLRDDLKASMEKTRGLLRLLSNIEGDMRNLKQVVLDSMRDGRNFSPTSTRGN